MSYVKSYPPRNECNANIVNKQPKKQSRIVNNFVKERANSFTYAQKIVTDLAEITRKNC